MNRDPRPTENAHVSSDVDTIAAIATPPGRAGIGIVRMSGPLARPIAQEIFIPKNPMGTLRSHRLYLGHLHDPGSGRMVDEVLLSYMRAPHTYTREDVIEINSHSGYLIHSKILQIILDRGARLARPGEFTLRAFLNGRIDLTQAEAVVDLINAHSERGLHLAHAQIQGTFRTKIEDLRNKALDLLANVEVAIDFPEEEAGIITRREAARRVEEELCEPIASLIEAHARKRLWVDGVGTAIVGRVNAGKSSLLNRLLNEQRAIVTPIPGTTRDVIESTITVRGLPLKLMDTAGLGRAKDEVERIGMHLTEKKLAEADLILLVIDRSRPLNQDDFSIMDQCRNKRVLVVLNKMDLPGRVDPEGLARISEQYPTAEISALTGQGLEDLSEAIVRSILEDASDISPSDTAPNLRHRQALSDAARFFSGAADVLEQKAPMEIVALEIRSGLDALGEIIGETATEDLLGRIFSRFCLGK
jgi:tRNA modification GTPase